VPGPQSVSLELTRLVRHIELVQAKKSAMSARTKRKICFGIMALIILVAAGVIVWFALRNRATNSSTAAPAQKELTASTTASTSNEVETRTVVQVVTQLVTEAPAATSTPVRSSAARTRASLLPRAMGWEDRHRAVPLSDEETKEEVDAVLGMPAYWL
jgi:hypothetical protein